MASGFKKPPRAKSAPSGMVTLVVVDNPDVQKALTAILAEVDASYRVYCSRNAWKLSAYDTDYTAVVSMKDDGLARLASLSREVLLAQTPDEVGGYEAHVVSRFLRKNKVNVPVRRVVLPSLDTGSVIYGFLHAADYRSSTEAYRSYEDRLVADRIVSEAVRDVLGKALPFDLDLGLVSLGLLSFICGGSRCEAVCDGISVSVPLDDPLPVHLESSERGNSVSLDDFMWHYGMYRPWIGSVKAIGSAYAAGAVTWPSSCGSRGTPADGGSWGMSVLEDSRAMSDAAAAVRDEVEFLSDTFRNEFHSGGFPFRTFSESEASAGETLTPSETPSRSQYEMASYLSRVGVPSRNWAYSALVLVRSGLAVQVGDSDFMATSNGRLVAAMAEEYFPELLDVEFLSFAMRGFMDDSVDSMDRYEFMESFRRTLSARVARAGDDAVPLPEPAKQCPVCGTSLELRVTAAGTYLSCRKRSCESTQFPVRYSNYSAFPVV